MSAVLEAILGDKVIAIIRGVPSNHMIDTVQALADGGVTCAEITFDPSSEEASRDTLRSIELVRSRFGEQILVGAGTVLTTQNAEDAAKAGALYLISPNTDRAVIERTKELGCLSIPGALTPSEAVSAHSWGADIIKLFPAGSLGIGYVKALLAPLSHLKTAAVGGVDETNMRDFLAAGVDCFGIGSNLVSAKKVAGGEFGQIREKARLLMAAARQ